MYPLYPGPFLNNLSEHTVMKYSVQLLACYYKFEGNCSGEQVLMKNMQKMQDRQTTYSHF